MRFKNKKKFQVFEFCSLHYSVNNSNEYINDQKLITILPMCLHNNAFLIKSILHPFAPEDELLRVCTHATSSQKGVCLPMLICGNIKRFPEIIYRLDCSFRLTDYYSLTHLLLLLKITFHSDENAT